MKKRVFVDVNMSLWLYYFFNYFFSGFEIDNFQKVSMCSEDSTANKRTDGNEDDSKYFQCNLSTYSTNHNGHFQQQYLVHSDEHPHECEICHRGFTSARNLRCHMLVHIKKPYFCYVCNMRFRQLGHLKLHMNKHL